MASTGGIEGLIETLRESIALARPNGFYGPADLYTVESAEFGLAGSGYGRPAHAAEIVRTIIEQLILGE